MYMHVYIYIDLAIPAQGSSQVVVSALPAMTLRASRAVGRLSQALRYGNTQVTRLPSTSLSSNKNNSRGNGKDQSQSALALRFD